MLEGLLHHCMEVHHLPSHSQGLRPQVLLLRHQLGHHNHRRWLLPCLVLVKHLLECSACHFVHQAKLYLLFLLLWGTYLLQGHKYQCHKRSILTKFHDPCLVHQSYSTRLEKEIKQTFLRLPIAILLPITMVIAVLV